MAIFTKVALCALIVLFATGSWTSTGWVPSWATAWATDVVKHENDDNASFLTGIEDLPLMEGLTETEDGGSTFDTPTGRFVEAYAITEKLTSRQILAFYTATLPQLGWSTIFKNTFHRDGETLKIEVLGEPPSLTVRFTVAPE